MAAVEPKQTRIAPGIRLKYRVQTIIIRSEIAPMAVGSQFKVWNCVAIAPIRWKKSWDMVHSESEEIANLRARDQDRDAVCEFDDDRPREEFNHRS
jgi:hypothetical protein